MEDTTMSKAARLQKIVHLLYRNPNGMTTKRIAEHCGVTPRIIQRRVGDGIAIAHPCSFPEPSPPPDNDVLAHY